jgi:hypothetical protein
MKDDPFFNPISLPGGSPRQWLAGLAALAALIVVLWLLFSWLGWSAHDRPAKAKAETTRR